MDCEKFQHLLADALGEELDAADRPAFEAHVAACARCRRDYESAKAAIAAMQRLPQAGESGARGLEDGFVQALSRARPARKPLATWILGAGFRYAAAILIAFMVGFVVRGYTPPARGSAPSVPTQSWSGAAADVERLPPSRLTASRDGTFVAALAMAYEQHPGRGNLANCMSALCAPVQQTKAPLDCRP